MKLLVLNTATAVANIVIKDEDKVYFKELTEKHSESVLPCVEELLSPLELTPRDLTHIAVVVGPGSFTGIRVGVSIAKAMMKANPSLKAVALTTLELIASSYSGRKNFTAVMNALSGKFYTLKEGGEPELKTLEQIEKDFKVGLKEENLDILDDAVEIDGPTLLKLALEKIERGELKASNELSPLYLRKSQAEENFSELKLEELSEQNLEEVYDISRHAFTDGWSLEQFREELGKEGHFGYVAVLSKAVGYVIVMETEGELGKDYNILSLAVSPKFLRRGIAKKLLSAVEDRARRAGVKKLWLEVKSKNEVALAFYKNFGFLHIATRKKYYRNGDDALILEKLLN